MSDFAALFGSGQPPKLWVSGTAYKINQTAISPLSAHIYLRKTNGAGTTDPATDKTNWRLIGPGGIKSRQSGTVATSGVGTGDRVATIALSTVDPSACSTNIPNTVFLGSAGCQLKSLSLTANQLAISYYPVSAGGTLYVWWEVIEYWS